MRKLNVFFRKKSESLLFPLFCFLLASGFYTSRGQNTEKLQADKDLKRTYPLTLSNEGKGKYHLEIKGIDSMPDTLINKENRIGGQEILLPYGRYRLKLLDEKRVVYRGRHHHSSNYKPVITLPVYSKTSFRTLSLDYVDLTDIEASIGQSQFFRGSGLSSSFLIFQYLHKGVKRSSAIIPEYIDTMAMLMPSVFLLNWDFRMGGSIFKYLDICALGRFKYSPGIKFLGVNINGYNDVSALSYFYGFELSTRLPYFNLNLKVGNQSINGKSFVYDKSSGDYSKEDIPLSISGTVVSFGLVINGPIEKTNNMLRLWKRPMVFDIFRRKFK
jgi:hypothetical protein